MASVPDWNNGSYTFDGDRRSAMRAFVQRITTSVRRIARRPPLAPAAPRSLIYVLCEEYRQRDLWAAYYAFRQDPRERTWQRLRRRNVPWQSAQTVEGLLQHLCPLNSKRTPDPNTVGLALVTAPSFSASRSKKKR